MAVEKKSSQNCKNYFLKTMNFEHEKQIKLVKTTLNKQDHFFV